MNAAGEASVSQSEQKDKDIGEKDAAPVAQEQQKTAESEKNEKPRNETKKAKAARLQKGLEQKPLPKPTQKLNVGEEGSEIWVKYSLEHAPFPHGAAKKQKTKHWIRREVQNRFVPYLLTYNVDILDKFDEDKMVKVLSSFIDHQPLYDDYARSEGHKIIEDKSFRGYCRNQLKAARTKKKADKKQHKGQETSETANSFGKLVASTDVSNAASDIDEEELEEDDEDDEMDISIVESNESGEIEDDVTDASESSQSKANSAGDQASAAGKAGRSRSESEASYSPHPVDEVLESRLNADRESHSEFRVDLPTTETKMPPVAGLKQQTLTVLAEVQKYYPGLATEQPHCLTCGEDGHVAAFCPRLSCKTCGERGVHFTYACPQNIVCAKCREKGHTVANCPEKLARSVSDGVVCEICSSTKHIGDNCHLLWRSYNPDTLAIKKVPYMLIDCYSCGALNHFGTECGLRGTRMPYAGQTWTAENRERYLEGNDSGSKDFPMRTKNGMSIRGMARNEPISISDSEEETFIRPKVVPQPQKTHLRFSDRVSLPNAPPRNNNLPMYAQQPPPPPRQDWAAVNGNGAYETFSSRNGMDYADDFRDNDDFHSFRGRDHDDLYRSSGRQNEPFRAANNGNNGRIGGGGGVRNATSDPFPARPQRNGGPSPGRGGRPPQNSGRGGGAGGRGRGGAPGGRGGRGGGAGGGGGRRGGRR